MQSVTSSTRQLMMEFDLMSLPVIKSFEIMPTMPTLSLPILEQVKVKILQEYSQTRDRNSISEQNFEHNLREIVQVLIADAIKNQQPVVPQVSSVASQTLPQTIIFKLEDKITGLKEELDTANHENQQLREDLKLGRLMIKDEHAKMSRLAEHAEQVRTDLQNELKSYQRLKLNLQQQRLQYKKLEQKLQFKLAREDLSMNRNQMIVEEEIESLDDSDEFRDEQREGLRN